MNEDILSQLSDEEQTLARQLAEIRARKASLIQQQNEALAERLREEKNSRTFMS